MEPKSAILERFERAVDLPVYLAYRGYKLVPNEQDASRLTMVHPMSGDALVLRKDLEKGSWAYTSLHDRNDQGGLGDYLRTRQGLPPPACLERVIALGNPLLRDAEGHRFREFARRVDADLGPAVSQHVAALKAEASTTHMLAKLGIAHGTHDEWRFGKIRNDEDLGKVLRDPTDLWASRYRPTDRKIVITEQPIDAMAYERSRGQQVCCYMATGGAPSDAQKRRLAHVLCEAPPGTTVVLAFGRDEIGRKLAADVQALLPAVKMERDMPAFGGRWSDQMKIEQRHARSMTRLAPSLGG